MTSVYVNAALTAVCVTVLGCGTSLNPWSHAPEPVPGLPDRFIPDSSFTLTSASDTTCLFHLIDPQTQTRLLLASSTYPAHVSDNTVRSAVGDYKVEPEGRFGIDEDHRLRVLCATGRPLGKVSE